MPAQQPTITVASLFHDRTQAEQCLQTLEQEGVPENAVTVLSRRTLRPDSFGRIHLERIAESAVYAALEAGAVLIAVQAAPGSLARVREILHLAPAVSETQSIAPRQGAPAINTEVDAPFQPSSRLSARGSARYPA